MELLVSIARWKWNT